MLSRRAGKHSMSRGNGWANKELWQKFKRLLARRSLYLLTQNAPEFHQGVVTNI
jgi:hypothetical protein